jgi:Tetracyclin repressor-like, C-terminal domain
MEARGQHRCAGSRRAAAVERACRPESGLAEESRRREVPHNAFGGRVPATRSAVEDWWCAGRDSNSRPNAPGFADEFLMRIQPQIGFPEHASALERLRQQMHLLAASFRGSAGQILRALLSEALTDAEFQVAIRDGWIAPRRALATVVIERAIAAKELPQHTSPDLLLDALYGGLYYWLLFDPARLTTTYIDSLFELVLHDASSHRRGRAQL